MELNSQLFQSLETLEPHHLKAILMWFHADSADIRSRSERFAQILSELENLDIDNGYTLVSSLDIDERVRLVLLNEFGPEMEGKSWFKPLKDVIARKLNA